MKPVLGDPATPPNSSGLEAFGGPLALWQSLRAARGFGGKSGEIVDISLLGSVPLHRLGCDQWLCGLQVRYSARPAEIYLAAHGGSEACDSELLGLTPAIAEALAMLARENASVAGGESELRGRSCEALRSCGQPRAVALAREQTNRAFCLEHQVFLKLQVRLEPGAGLESHRLEQLGRVAPQLPIPEWLGEVTWHQAGCETAPLALLTAWCDADGDAFESLVQSWKNGSDLPSFWPLLGQQLAQLHAGLRLLEPTHDANSESARGYHQARVAAARQRLLRLSPYLESRRGLSTRLEQHLVHWSRLDHCLELQAVHGDFHLGQVLSTPSGFRLIDFGGEPQVSPEQRRQPGARLVDLAGLLRSVDYAAACAAPELADFAASEQLQSRAESLGVALVSAYFTETARLGYHDGQSQQVRPWLEALLLDKALRELEYELDHRPDWAPIPTAALERLAQRQEVSQ